MKTFYNLPKKIEFCSKCVLSNQVPASIPEYLHKPNRQGATYLQLKKDINGQNICSACQVNEMKKKLTGKKEKKIYLKFWISIEAKIVIMTAWFPEVEEKIASMLPIF